MNPLYPLRYVGDAWIFFWIWWLVASRRANKARKRESRSGRMTQLAIAAIAVILFSTSKLNLGPLNRRFVPRELWSSWLGVALTVAGVAFAIWARQHIGKYWSAAVSIVSEHRLIRTGPYARIRHPIYTGILIALVGTALAFGRYRDLVAFLIVLFGLIQKARREEAFLRDEFGGAFEEHRRATGFLLPKLS